MAIKLWKYDVAEVRDDVKWTLPDNSSLEIYKIVSGDSGKIYYTQVLRISSDPSSKAGLSKPIYLCNCPEGTFRAPLSVVGQGPVCKHAENLAAFLEEKKRK